MEHPGPNPRAGTGGDHPAGIDSEDWSCVDYSLELVVAV